MNDKTRPTSKPKILDVAVSLAKAKGLKGFSREDIAKAAKVAEATVSFHFGTMAEMRAAIVKHAIANEILPILADVRSSREKGYSGRMPAALVKKVANYIAKN